MNREAAAELFRLFPDPNTGVPLTVEQRVALIETIAADLLADLRAVQEARAAGKPHRRGRFGAGDIKRWTVRHLELCSGVFFEPAPPSLVKLARELIDVKPAPRKEIKNLEKWCEAADYVAKHPGATVSAIRRAIGYDQSRIIKSWMAQPEFQHEVRRRQGT